MIDCDSEIEKTEIYSIPFLPVRNELSAYEYV